MHFEQQSWQSRIIAHPKPGPLPVILLPLHSRQDVCLKGWHELLHHQVTQDLGSGGRGRVWSVPSPSPSFGKPSHSSPPQRCPLLHVPTALSPKHPSQRPWMICLAVLQIQQGPQLRTSARAASPSRILPQPPSPARGSRMCFSC